MADDAAIVADTQEPIVNVGGAEPSPSAIPAAAQPADAATQVNPVASAAAPSDSTIVADAGKPVAEPKWRDDWREVLAAGDDAKAKWLARHKSVDSLMTAAWDANNKIKSGMLKAATLPEKPTEEDIAIFRKAWGVPDAPEGYDVKVPDGIDFQPSEKQTLDEFVAEMHKGNIPKDTVQKITQSYFNLRAREEQALYDAAMEKTMNTRVEIKAEFGRDFDRNVKIGNADMVQVLGADRAKELASLTLADGTKLGDEPNFVRYIVSSAMRAADDDMLVAPESNTGGKTIDQRIAEIRQLQYGSENDKRKFHSPEIQTEYNKLYDRKARQANASAA